MDKSYVDVWESIVAEGYLKVEADPSCQQYPESCLSGDVKALAMERQLQHTSNVTNRSLARAACEDDMAAVANLSIVADECRVTCEVEEQTWSAIAASSIPDEPFGLLPCKGLTEMTHALAQEIVAAAVMRAQPAVMAAQEQRWAKVETEAACQCDVMLPLAEGMPQQEARAASKVLTAVIARVLARPQRPKACEATKAKVQDKWSLMDGELTTFCSDCPICYEQVHRPVVLPCQHTFCADCLLRAVSEYGGLSCPLCRGPLCNGSRRHCAAADDHLPPTSHSELFHLDLDSNFGEDLDVPPQQQSNVPSHPVLFALWCLYWTPVVIYSLPLAVYCSPYFLYCHRTRVPSPRVHQEDALSVNSDAAFQDSEDYSMQVAEEPEASPRLNPSLALRAALIPLVSASPVLPHTALFSDG